MHSIEQLARLLQVRVAVEQQFEVRVVVGRYLDTVKRNDSKVIWELRANNNEAHWSHVEELWHFGARVCAHLNLRADQL